MTNTHKNHQNKKHFPVLLSEVLQYLDPQKGEKYLDLTAGYGGHAEKVLERTLSKPHITLVDRDQNAVDHLSDLFGDDVEIIHKDFLAATQDLVAAGRQYDLILADLGVSSPHIDEARRGFSLRNMGPLDMRMDNRQSLTADVIVNSYSQAELCTILREYGEEPRANKIARLIVEHRPIATTLELAEIVARAWPGYSKVHPATRTFQAIRIAVNDELGLLTQSLPLWMDLLTPGGRIAVISFHSMEDRIVKQFFAEHAGNRYDAVLRQLTRQPIMAGSEELVFNPRSRSAKLRVAVKQK